MTTSTSLCQDLLYVHDQHLQRSLLFFHCSIPFAHQPFIMINLRAASRVSRTVCLRSSFRQIRHESTSTSSSSSGSSLSQSIAGGLAGGGLVFLSGYAYYHFSGNTSFEVTIGYHIFMPHDANNLQEPKPSSIPLERPRMHLKAMESNSKSRLQIPT